MGLHTRIDTAVKRAVAMGQGGRAPARLSGALHYACTPGGARIRPTILMTGLCSLTPPPPLWS